MTGNPSCCLGICGDGGLACGRETSISGEGGPELSGERNGNLGICGKDSTVLGGGAVALEISDCRGPVFSEVNPGSSGRRGLVPGWVTPEGKP